MYFNTLFSPTRIFTHVFKRMFLVFKCMYQTHVFLKFTLHLHVKTSTVKHLKTYRPLLSLPTLAQIFCFSSSYRCLFIIIIIIFFFKAVRV